LCFSLSHFTNGSEYIRDLIRRDQASQAAKHADKIR
jgi:Arc/MetJ-type ribon-helix-helix transcriptional regulator